uniref:Uncharacterized protein n=1 Tax=Rhizophagus irregularis (strain DAOM 181602 / DAOM 197198 / MUCL 43194) TaxID=747089 RepID=U9UDN0_RHIID
MRPEEVVGMLSLYKETTKSKRTTTLKKIIMPGLFKTTQAGPALFRTKHTLRDEEGYKRTPKNT